MKLPNQVAQFLQASDQSLFALAERMQQQTRDLRAVKDLDAALNAALEDSVITPEELESLRQRAAAAGLSDVVAPLTAGDAKHPDVEAALRAVRDGLAGATADRRASSGDLELEMQLAVQRATEGAMLLSNLSKRWDGVAANIVSNCKA